jgi:glycosyltransferase involved in cell wall biosynthesis
MRLAFNATSLLSPLTGIGQYSRQLAMGLAEYNAIDVDFFYGAFWQKSVRAEPIPGAQTLLPWIRSNVPGSYALRRLVQQQRFSAHAKSEKFNLYHEPNILPMPFDGPMVVTVHDLSWIRYPETHPVERVRAMNKYFESGLRQASLILTDSEFVKREIIDVFGTNPDSILSIPLGVEPLFHPRNAMQTRPTLNKHRLNHAQYLLAVGTLEPRKNLELALDAYQQLPASLRKHYPLVLVGMKGWLASGLQKKMAPLIDSGEVRCLGYLTRTDLACVMAGATALIYPSLYEGFGLPPLESMACGVPVIASNVSSLPEVVGDTGFLIEPSDLGAAALALEEVISNSALRTRMAQMAKDRSLNFTWKNCVSNTINAYHHVLKTF